MGNARNLRTCRKLCITAYLWLIAVPQVWAADEPPSIAAPSRLHGIWSGQADAKAESVTFEKVFTLAKKPDVRRRQHLTAWIQSGPQATGTATPSAPANPIAGLPVPIAHWKLDDEGREVRDSVGSHHGMIHGAVSHEGRFGKALLFDRAKGDYVSIPHSPDFEIGTFTVSAWVWLTKEPTFSGILGTRFGGEFNFDMKVNTDKVHGDIGDGTRWIDTKINFYKDDVGSNGQGGDLKTQRWYLITFVVDNEQKECRLYLDADRKKTIAFKGEPRLMRPGQTMRIGCAGTGEFMDGLIDDVRIWKQALADEHVRSLIAP